MPGAGGFERNSDPLGLGGSAPPPPAPHPQQQHHQQHQVQPQQQGIKRRVSEEMGGQNAKKFIVAGPWDLEIPTNVILYEKTPSMLPHPHPEVEILRFQLMMGLRKSYQEM